MARHRGLKWLFLLPLAALLVSCESESPFERRLRVAREQQAFAHQEAMTDFPLARDLDELELDDLYSFEVASIVGEGVLWICDVSDIDIERRDDGGYLVSASGPQTRDDEYYLLLSSSEEQVQQFLENPPERRYRTSYLFVVRLRTVSKPSLQLEAEVFEYDEMGPLSHVVFQGANARILHGELVKVYQH